LPNREKFTKYDEIIQPIAEELKLKRENFPLTIVYVESLEALGYFYQFLNYELKEDQYIGDPIPENRIFGQFHKDYTNPMKQHIISELCNSVGFSNSSFGYGIRCTRNYPNHTLQTPNNFGEIFPRDR
jgi:thermostable 8-oxoguanine DNA glycosylase